MSGEFRVWKSLEFRVESFKKSRERRSAFFLKIIKILIPVKTGIYFIGFPIELGMRKNNLLAPLSGGKV
jgi:hypothetical protein